MNPRRVALIVFAILSLGLALATGRAEGSPQTSRDESQEPAVSYSLTLGERKVEIEEGKSVEITGSFTNPQVTLEASASRTFPYLGLSFAYPRSFTFEADFSSPESKSWTLSGNDFKIIVFSLAGDVSARKYVESVGELLGDGTMQRSKAELKLGSLKVDGAAVRFKLVGTSMRMEAYKLPSLAGRTRLLVLQDVPPEGKTESPEAISTRALIESTFRLTEK